jgi:hypothetical protein
MCKASVRVLDGSPPIPEGFQRIAGDQRSATTGQMARAEHYPEGIEAVPVSVSILMFKP